MPYRRSMQSESIGAMMDDKRYGAEGLVPCHVDISCLYADATNPLGLSALVDLSDVGPVPGCAAMPAIYFPRASAEKIVEKSNDPMIGDDALSWDGDAIVDEYDGAVDPISIEGNRVLARRVGLPLGGDGGSRWVVRIASRRPRGNRPRRARGWSVRGNLHVGYMPIGTDLRHRPLMDPSCTFTLLHFYTLV